MVTINVVVPKMSFPDYDYFFEREAEFEKMLANLTPKFSGKWNIILYEPAIAYVKELLKADTTPSFVNCMVFVGSKKYDTLALTFPDLEETRKSVWDNYQDMLLQLNHTISKKASSLLYKAVGADLEKLHQALRQLDLLCEGSEITESLIRKHFIIQSHVYANQVFESFVTNDSKRWKLYEQFHKELGSKSAFYAMRNYTKQLLKAKDDYLHNKDIKMHEAKRIDAASVSYAYALFNTVDNYKALPALMYELENRSQATLERMLSDVNI